MTDKCSVCHGSGLIMRCINYSDYIYNADEPIYEEEICENCEGLGRELIYDPEIDNDTVS